LGKQPLVLALRALALKVVVDVSVHPCLLACLLDTSRSGRGGEAGEEEEVLPVLAGVRG
jgi:hypothetical protein